MEIIELTILAYGKIGAGKALIINKIDVKLKIVKLFVRMSGEIGSMKMGNVAIIVERLLEIGKIVGGWIKTTKGP